MAAIRSFTSLEQSRKLAEFLPLESADMYYRESKIPDVMYGCKQNYRCYTMCWSLAALFGVLPLVDLTTPQLIGTPKTLYRCVYNDDLKSHAHDNAVDACYEMIIRLNELKVL